MLHCRYLESALYFSFGNACRCAFVQSLLRKLNAEDVLQVAPNVMQAVIQMLSTTSTLPSGGVQEDAIMTVSVLVECECSKQTARTHGNS